jgi:hypothetical protein
VKRFWLFADDKSSEICNNEDICKDKSHNIALTRVYTR